MNAKRAAKLMQIAHYYGEEKQVCKLMEELGEATSAASEVLTVSYTHLDVYKRQDRNRPVSGSDWNAQTFCKSASACFCSSDNGFEILFLSLIHI